MHEEIVKLWWNLSPGDCAIHGEEKLSFIKIDGMYCVWENDRGERKIGNAYSYTLKDGIYYPNL